MADELGVPAYRRGSRDGLGFKGLDAKELTGTRIAVFMGSLLDGGGEGGGVGGTGFGPRAAIICGGSLGWRGPSGGWKGERLGLHACEAEMEKRRRRRRRQALGIDQGRGRRAAVAAVTDRQDRSGTGQRRRVKQEAKAVRAMGWCIVVLFDTLRLCLRDAHPIIQRVNTPIR
jgi:hypothetical protein